MNFKSMFYRLMRYKTIDELLEEMKAGRRGNIAGKTLDNARKMTDALLPTNIRFPKDAEVFEALQDVEISYLTHHFAPFTGGDKAVLKMGERIIVHEPNRPRPVSVYCTAVNYTKLENEFVPLEVRNDPTYSDYSLSINTVGLNKYFKQIAVKPILYNNGKVTELVGEGLKVVVHLCNDMGVWENTVAKKISGKWKLAESGYKDWFNGKDFSGSNAVHFKRVESLDKYNPEMKFKLGNVQFVKVAEDIWVANILALVNVTPDEQQVPPIREVFVRECLERVREFAAKNNGSVHIPREGWKEVGAKWPEIKSIINHQLIAYEIETTVYALA